MPSKIILIILCLSITNPLLAQDKQKYPYRPNLIFLEKGKENEREKAYLLHKESEISSYYKKIFTNHKFNELMIYKIVYRDIFGPYIQIKQFELVRKINAASEEFVKYANFFSMAFPDKCLKPVIDNDIHGKLYIFKGEHSSNAFIFYKNTMFPEFAIIDLKSDVSFHNKTYAISKGAMSAHQPLAE